jgi:chemotaxis protein CheD
MGTLMIGIGDYGASKTPGDVVKTMALGSCVAVIFLVPKTRCVGMVHVALPESKIDAGKGAAKPGHFADTGVPALFKEVCRVGGQVTMKDVYVKIAGGANVLGASNTFDIGRRNVLAVKKVLWQMGTGPVAEDVEGHFSRTVTVDISSGTIELSSPAKGKWTL